MTALKILQKALVNIFADFGQTLRIFALPSLLIVGSVMASGQLFLLGPRFLQMLAGVIATAVVIFCAFWEVVNFHRHLILGERFGWLPRIHGRAMLGYGFMTIPLALIVMGCSFAMALVIGQIFDGMPADALLGNGFITLILIALVSSTLLTALSLRLFSLLPGLAIGQPMRGYARGRGNSLLTLLLIAIVLSLLQIGYEMIPQFIARGFGPEAMVTYLNAMRIAGTIVNILASVYAISLLSVLYETYVGEAAP